MREYQVRLLALFSAALFFGSIIWAPPNTAPKRASGFTFAESPSYLGKSPDQGNTNSETVLSSFFTKKIENITENSTTSEQTTLANHHSSSDEQDIFLRPDFGRHASIWDSAYSEDEKLFVTVGKDNAIRLFDVDKNAAEPFALRLTFRAPIASNSDFFTRVAITENGNLIAAAREVEVGNEISVSIFLLDVKTGNVLDILPAGNARIWSLTFSPRGDMLFAGAEKTGITSWEQSNSGAWNINNVMQEMGDETPWAFAFTRRNETIVSSTDGLLRVYDRRYELKNAVQPFSRGAPRGLAVSPDGKAIAVTNEVYGEAVVLSLPSLETQYALPAQIDIRWNRRTSHVEWTSTNFICIGGDASAAINSRLGVAIRCFKDGFIYGTFKVAADTISSIEKFDDDAVAFVSRSGAMGILIPDTRSKIIQEEFKQEFIGYIQEIARNENATLISEDGSKIAWPIDRERESYTQSPTYLLFDLEARELTRHALAPEGLSPPKITDDNTRVSNWNDRYNPVVHSTEYGSRRLPFPATEKSHNMVMAEDAESFVIATDFRLKKLSIRGEVLWEKPYGAYRVNISGDQKLVIAAKNDGTIDWINYETGVLLATLLPLVIEDEMRWVAWTPSGYYDASAGAEDLVGWQVNRGKDSAALFFDLSRFRNAYNRPEFVKETVLNRELFAAPNRSDILELAPPIVTLTETKPGRRNTVTVSYRVDPFFDGPIDIDAFVDGSKLSLTEDRRNITPGTEGSFDVEVFSANAEIAIVAVGDGKRSAPGVATARGEGDGDPDESLRPTPKLFAVVVGVSDYLNNTQDLFDLSFSDDDASDFGQFLRSQRELGLYDEVHVKILPEGGSLATKGEITAALESLLPGNENVGTDVPTEHDVTIFFFAGHGIKDGQQNKLYLMPYDANVQNLEGTAIEGTYLQTTMSSILGRKFVFLDACYSGFETRPNQGLFDTVATVNSVGTSDGFVEVLTSSSANELSWEFSTWNNGAFTQALMELMGAESRENIDPQSALYIDGAIFDGVVDNSEIVLYTQHRVEHLVAEGIGVKQTPLTSKFGSYRSKLVEISE